MIDQGCQKTYVSRAACCSVRHSHQSFLREVEASALDLDVTAIVFSECHTHAARGRGELGMRHVAHVALEVTALDGLHTLRVYRSAKQESQCR